AWRRILDAADPPMTTLHTTDFLARYPGHPYGHWSDERKHEFLESLTRVITYHVDYACGVVFLPDGLAELQKDHAQRRAAGRANTLSNNPYEICVDTCVGLIRSRLERVGHTTRRRVAYFLEQGDPGQGAYYQSVTALMQKSRQYCDDSKILSVT